jgi:hypothetical protein
VKGSYRVGGLRIDYAPHVRLTVIDDLSHIDLLAGDETHHVLAVPITMNYPLSETFVGQVQTGLLSEFDDFLSPFPAYEIPFGIGGLYRMQADFWLGAHFYVNNVLGTAEKIDGRSLQIVAAYAL